MRRPVPAPELAKQLALEKARAALPVLSDELRAHFKRLEQGRVDHIQRRDRNWDDALRGQS